MRNLHRKVFSLLFSLLFGFSFYQCSGSGGSDMSGLALMGLADSPPSATTTEALTRYADLAYESYNQAVTDATSLQTAIATFNGSPNDTNLTAVKNAWVVARSSYLVTEAFRFSKGPIDLDPGYCGGSAPYSGTDECEGALNSWPLDEDVIDNYIGATAIGSITFANIYSKNGDSTLAAGSEGDPDKVVMTGYHSIEYLLWGKDDSGTGPGGAINNVPGQRTASYFQDATNGTKRLKFLSEVTVGLIGHLTQVRDQWVSTDASNFRAVTFLSSGNESTSLSNVFKGMGEFVASEWGGDRLAGIASQSQEDEHSCFSDTTKADFYYDAQGFVNIWSGNYSVKKNVNISTGPGLSDLLSAKNRVNVLSDASKARDTFCINLDDETTDPNYTTHCPSGSITHRYDQIIINPSDSQHTALENLQTLISDRLARDFASAATKLGVDLTP
ncbi:imelysin [Leptospira semungkisensis]|uniref:Imelysin n=1 Tax=Leptospira semungkisensis TaxID=2484985 RepID=A0A4R9G5M1_9LEPT|nr:imelysin family protein [Leptospira semungkisensis]TGK06754.1 imelysin [Leptospira semungkisensis]